ncbi:MAG: electron transfer flavoprotein subunit beta [Gammaproteobacteria bacterium]
MLAEIAVLVSVGRHPASLRPRRADLDARAVELALRLGGRVHLIHAGGTAEPALSEYLALGAERLTVLRTPPQSDVAPALIAHLQTLQPALVLAGLRTEQGLGGGALPYAIAHGLGWPLAAAIADLALADGQAHLLQALPRGQRRALRAPLPLVATIDSTAPAPRLGAYALACHGSIEVRDAHAAAPPLPPLDELPAKRRPKRLQPPGQARQAEQQQTERVKLLIDPHPQDAARAIYDYLIAEGILRRGR